MRTLENSEGLRGSIELSPVAVGPRDVTDEYRTMFRSLQQNGGVRRDDPVAERRRHDNAEVVTLDKPKTVASSDT